MEDGKNAVRRRKIRGAVIAGVVMALLLLATAGFYLWAFTMAEFPLLIMVLFLLIPLIVLVCIGYVLWQRIQEIKKGEEEDAVTQY